MYSLLPNMGGFCFGDLKVLLSAWKKSDDGQSFALGMWPARSMNAAPP